MYLQYHITITTRFFFLMTFNICKRNLVLIKPSLLFPPPPQTLATRGCFLSL